MKPKILIPIGFLVLLFCAFPLWQTNAQSLKFSGRILSRSMSQKSIPRFNVKLYPPKTSGKPILLTTTDIYGNFSFSNLSASSYLLEVYLGKDLVYQEVIDLRTSINRDIDLDQPRNR